MAETIVVAGATGNLGGRIARSLLQRGAGVVALARPGSAADTVAALESLGARVARADPADARAIAAACAGAACVVSAVQGLRDAIVDAQSALLAAGVPRAPRRGPARGDLYLQRRLRRDPGPQHPAPGRQ